MGKGGRGVPWPHTAVVGSVSDNLFSVAFDIWGQWPVLPELPIAYNSCTSENRHCSDVVHWMRESSTSDTSGVVLTAAMEGFGQYSMPGSCV